LSTIDKINEAHRMSSSSSSSEPSALEGVYVMVNGMPGPMATAAAEACLRKGLNLAPTALTGPDVPPHMVTVTDPVTAQSAQVRLVPAIQDNKEELVASIAGMRQAAGGGASNLLVIDFTHPSAVNDNARFYVEQRLPFVMGTTGGDRQRLADDVREGQLPCVISPNMGKQIVALQAALEDLATKYPGAFAGYSLAVTESHQVTKADTSGTALSVISSINKLLAPNEQFSPTNVQLIRDEARALEFGVPETALKGHAFHTYQLTSPDGSVTFQLQHNVAGRTIYAEGTADAVKFLAKKLRQGTDPPQIYTMMNVLEEGALE
jgi:4-hydroxy-tetrahydrodipicolinate reductase